MNHHPQDHVISYDDHLLLKEDQDFIAEEIGSFGILICPLPRWVE